ncbi:MAG TPA: class I SAM-dependent methyltransferase, partial [Anaerolineales bacterium]|nr:class I SAM-dependent methyltransferase [Anaerolineales bacterium]
SKAKRLRENARAGYADAERIESTLARCEKCGAFLDKNGECNNPNCPTHRPVLDDDPETYGDSLEDFEAAAFSGIPDDESTSAPSPAQARANSPQYEVRFNRRKYGSQTYTWAHVKSPVTGEWLSVGDPWPGTTWPQERLAESIAITLESENTSGDESEPAAPTQTFSRCEKCGVFMDKNGQCNNAKCPKNTGEAETDENGRKRTETNGNEAEEEEEIFDDETFDDETFEEPALAVPQGHDYHITDADELGKGGAKTKARQNIEAIKLIQKLEEEGRMATPEEQAVLVKFVGWGGLPQMFDSRNEWWRPGLSYSGQKPEFYDEYQELKKLLTEEEWRAASRSTVNAHYTSATVVRGVWDALKHMGYDRADGNVLEPAVGSGNFFGVMPEEFQASHKVGVELDAFTARIARHLYQNADVRNIGFEKTNLPNDFFDLAISNVPFGNFPVVDREFQGTRRFLTRSIHNFFFAKALDKVKPGGTVAFISSRYTLDSKDDSIRKYLAEKADLVGAIRLPNTAFKE